MNDPFPHELVMLIVRASRCRWFVAAIRCTCTVYGRVTLEDKKPHTSFGLVRARGKEYYRYRIGGEVMIRCPLTDYTRHRSYIMRTIAREYSYIHGGDFPHHIVHKQELFRSLPVGQGMRAKNIMDSTVYNISMPPIGCDRRINILLRPHIDRISGSPQDVYFVISYPVYDFIELCSQGLYAADAWASFCARVRTRAYECFPNYTHNTEN